MKGTACNAAGSYCYDVNYKLTQHLPQRPSSYFINNSENGSVLIDDSETNSENETFISDDDKEDEDLACGHIDLKCRWVAKRHPTFVYAHYPTYPPFLNYHSSYFNASPYFFGQTSNKYIFQRVLRI